MAVKKVKFPLDMGNDVLVRDIDELKDNFNIEKVTEYFLNGKLLTWLNDRFYEEEAEQVKELSSETDKSLLAGKLCRIFDIENEDNVDIEAIEKRKERLEKLRSLTSDDEVIENVDDVAFSQEELGDLLDEDIDVIYLCGEKFRIPLSVKNKKYIGVNSPELTISTKNETIDLSEYGIVVEKCTFSDKTAEKMVKKNEEVQISDDEESSSETESETKSDTDPKIEKFIAFLHNKVDRQHDELEKEIEQENNKKGDLGAFLNKMSVPKVYITTYFVNWSDTGYTNSSDVMDALEKQYNDFMAEKTELLNDPKVNNIYYCRDIKTMTSGCLCTRENMMLPFKGDAARISISVPKSLFEKFKKEYMTPIALTYLSEKVPSEIVEAVVDGLAPINDFKAYYLINMPKFLKLFANEMDQRSTLYISNGYSIHISCYERVNKNSIASTAAKFKNAYCNVDTTIAINKKTNIYDRVTELIHHYYKYDMNYDNANELSFSIHYCDYVSGIDVVTDTEEIKNSLIKQYNDTIKSIGSSPIVYPENINSFVSGALVFDLFEVGSDFKMHEKPTKDVPYARITIPPHKFAEFAKEYLTPIVYIPCKEKFSDDLLIEMTKIASLYPDSVKIVPGYIINIPKLIDGMKFESQYLRGSNELCRTDYMGGTYSKEKFNKVYESVNSYKRSSKVSEAIKEYNGVVSSTNPMVSLLKKRIPNI